VGWQCHSLEREAIMAARSGRKGKLFDDFADGGDVYGATP
jgi:hypothetical protein